MILPRTHTHTPWCLAGTHKGNFPNGWAPAFPLSQVGLLAASQLSVGSFAQIISAEISLLGGDTYGEECCPGKQLLQGGRGEPDREAATE